VLQVTAAIALILMTNVSRRAQLSVPEKLLRAALYQSVPYLAFSPPGEETFRQKR
jgi:hypothetical protein